MLYLLMNISNGKRIHGISNTKIFSRWSLNIFKSKSEEKKTKQKFRILIYIIIYNLKINWLHSEGEAQKMDFINNVISIIVF